MMPYKRHVIGQKAEERACHFLLNKGLTLVTRNYLCYHGEIDIIMRDRDDIVFVEVRLKQGNLYGNALESIDAKKTKRLIKTANHFLQVNNCFYQVNSRFDIIVFQSLRGKMQLEWIKNALTDNL